ncbi:hypothetical protein V6N13_032826 [Hibiscus sabdariffa]|uniref:Uncharacterized protein n=2 Tax=Hibiscus sabdariffa TaxID=183260 RepID=A0ABR1ZKL5_9ROSI
MSKAGDIGHALKLFDQIPEPKSVFLWNTMIKDAGIEYTTGRIHDGEYSPGLCSSGGITDWEWIKTYIDRNKVKNYVFLGNALIDMCSEYGSVAKARRVFSDTSLTINGHGEEALGYSPDTSEVFLDIGVDDKREHAGARSWHWLSGSIEK